MRLGLSSSVVKSITKCCSEHGKSVNYSFALWWPIDSFELYTGGTVSVRILGIGQDHTSNVGISSRRSLRRLTFHFMIFSDRIICF